MKSNNENNINNEIDSNQHKHQDAEIKFNKDLANQEWVNEGDSIRYRVFGGCYADTVKILPIIEIDIVPFLIFHSHNELYYIHQNKFEKSHA